MRSLSASGVLIASILWLVGCASTAPERVVSRIPVSEQSYILDPLTGYPLTLPAGSKQRLRDAFAGFAAGVSLAEVAAEADSVIVEDPSQLPATVLRAQVDFLTRHDRAVVEQLQPVLDELPDYVAAALLSGRAHERLGATITAFEIFDGLSEINRVAASRSDELWPKAVDIVERRFDDALKRGRAEEAALHVDQLEAWSMEELGILELRHRLYFETGNALGELETLRRSLELGREKDPGSEDSESVFALRRRLAELELEVGDVRVGMDIFEALAMDLPDDPDLLDQVDRARFLWRMELLPPQIKEIARSPELSRADLASLLYWLFPNVRFSEVEDPPIAADILDHENREEVLRVLDLDLMAVDETVHRFRPELGATRRVALASLVTLLRAAEPPSPCVAGEMRASAADRSRRWVCEKAVLCGLINETTECLPAATLSGNEAVDLVRRCLDHMGSP